jgi:nitrogenase subunit NifH
MKQQDVYRVRISLDHPTEEIYRDIYMSTYCSLEALKNIVLKFFKLNKKMIASFYIYNEKGESEEEILSAELGEDIGFRLLHQVEFSDIIQQNKNLIFAAHGIKVRFFHIEILGQIKNHDQDDALPKLLKSQGEIPRTNKNN